MNSVPNILTYIQHLQLAHYSRENTHLQYIQAVKGYVYKDIVT